MNILEKIIEAKKSEIEQRKKEVPVQKLSIYPGFNRKCNSLKTRLLKNGSSGIIAEFKKKSPSKGEINFNVSAEDVTKSYVEAGAAGLSVLTDLEFFGGKLEDLIAAREANPGIPILRKDFIIDEYQIVEAKAFGADVILLIAANLDEKQALALAKKAKNLGMEVLMEVHNAKELKKLNDFIDIVGVNNRNLKTFKTSVEISAKLAGLIPHRYLKISESGLEKAETIQYLREKGFRGFLIGETFMKTKNPGEACKNVIAELTAISRMKNEKFKK